MGRFEAAAGRLYRHRFPEAEGQDARGTLLSTLEYLLDTSIISQTEKAQPDTAVARWWGGQKASSMALSSIVIAELRFGIELRDPDKRQNELRSWLESLVLTAFSGRILPIDEKVGDQCGRLIATAKKSGHTPEMADALIAATALVHGLKLVTLNRKHFERLGVEIIIF